MTIMEATKLKIGDIVICNTSFKNLPQKGWKGKVIHLKPYIGVEWDNCFYYGHNCKGVGASGRCRWYAIELNKKITIDYSILILDLIKQSQLEFEF